MYFRDFQTVDYKFGNEEFTTKFPNIATYVDVVDQLRQTVGFYREFYIPEGGRPDTISFELYGRSDYYWTFFMMNNHLREQGWPLDTREIRPFLRENYPNTTFVTTDLDTLYENFLVGQQVTTQTGETVAIVDRNLNLGQIVTELVSGDNTGTLLNLVGASGVSLAVSKQSEQYLSTHHYENASGEWIDIDPTSPDVSALVDVSFLEHYERINEQNRFINILKPDVISEVVRDFKQKATV
jgi:hypothetical protein